LLVCRGCVSVWLFGSGQAIRKSTKLIGVVAIVFEEMGDGKIKLAMRRQVDGDVVDVSVECRRSTDVFVEA
jgi:hypothetical protein